MLHTNCKLSTTKQAFKWFFELQKNPKIKLESAQVMHQNSFHNINLSTLNFDKFYWDYADGVQKIIMNCLFNNHPIKVTLLIDNLQNRLFIETDNPDLENKLVKCVF